MSRRFHRALIALLALPGCDGRGAPESAAFEGARVVDGELSPVGSNEDAVLLMRTELEGAELVCSTTLVAPNLVLTARHCVSHLVRGRFSCTVQGELVSNDPYAGLLGAHLPADELEFYGGETPRDEPFARGVEVISTLSETICLNDVAFVLLDRSLELPVLPIRLEGRARRGDAVTLVGYGLDGTTSEIEGLDVRTQPRTRNDELEITEVGPRSSDDLVITVPPRTIAIDGPSGCFGDSGGPLLARDTEAVLGVYSLLAGSSCNSPDGRHFFAHLPDFPALLRDAFELAGAEPVPEPEPSAGAGGESGAPSHRGGEAGALQETAGEGGFGGVSSAGTAGEGPAGAPGTGEAGAPASGGVPGDEEPVVPPTTRPVRRDAGCSLAVRATARSSSALFGWFAVFGALFALRRR